MLKRGQVLKVRAVAVTLSGCWSTFWFSALLPSSGIQFFGHREYNEPNSENKKVLIYTY